MAELSLIKTERAPADAPVIQVRDFIARAGARTIVQPLSFSVSAGEVLALVGESGSGKTTTGLALLGEASAGVTTTGSITTGSTEGDQGRIAYIPQHPGAVLTPGRRVGAVLREIAAAHLRASGRGTAASARREVVDLVDHAIATAQFDPALLRRYPHQLSGGQQQRVVLAQALIGDPVALVADEPTTGQDGMLREAIVGELRSLVDLGLALVLLSHDLDIVRRLADQTIVLRDGHVVERGPAVLQSPQSDYARQLVADSLPPESQQAPPALDSQVLKAEGLTAGYRSGRRAIDVLTDTSFGVESGECVAIIGPSGAGKSTLGRCIAGLHTPRSGALTLSSAGVPWPVRRRTMAQLADCQYVFQDARASFDPYRTIGDQVARSAVRLRGLSAADARQQAAEAFDRMELPRDKLSSHSTELSGGELQRASLARALLASPKLLICDEVTSGLDVVTRAQILALLEKLCREDGLGLLLITHEPAVVRRLAHRVLRLSNGRLEG